ncbi:transcriptional regulator [Longimycelium tulufanense]|uniref:Transcriptional regulator n=1 Tax=Longimycelium tulufanense TaxID=907463 RepID=A0A8J3C728_9PSEU|nr:helix-turn-helix transcriptional regulator [Longimycelium tulufanense]GGM46531.1 transcriptional regulator [Longimycelium tulufanense]
MAKVKKPELRPPDIGARARMIRRRRGMSLDVVAGLAGISKSYLSMLESGEHRFERRSLIDRVAEALGCSVIDLTGEPYGPSDRRSAEALAAIPTIELALHDCTLDDVPDEPARPITALTSLVHEANHARDHSRYDTAGRDLGQIMTELQILSMTSDNNTKRQAWTLLVEACFVAYAVAKAVGHTDLALEAARRGYDAARRLDDPFLIGFTTWFRALALQRIGARRRVTTVLSGAIDELEPIADPTVPEPRTAEAYGLMHLTTALHSARLGQSDQVQGHLAEARRVAERTGERNTLRTHFGPTNVAVWHLSIGVELEEGAGAYERTMRANLDLDSLDSAGRVGNLYLDLARSLAQESGARDSDAIRYLDRADRCNPIRVRHDSVVRELLAELENRARIRSWELGSLRNRFGVN